MVKKSTMLTIAGLDLSTKSGICIVSVDCNGTITPRYLAEIFVEYDHAYFSKLLRAEHLSVELCSACEDHYVDIAIIEGFAYANKYTWSILSQIRTLVEFELYKLGIPFVDIAPKSLKKYTTGSGDATKKRMQSACEARYNLCAYFPDERLTDNKVDAFALAMLLCDVYAQGVNVNKLNRAYVDDVLKCQYSGGHLNVQSR